MSTKYKNRHLEALKVLGGMATITLYASVRAPEVHGGTASDWKAVGDDIRVAISRARNGRELVH